MIWIFFISFAGAKEEAKFRLDFVHPRIKRKTEFENSFLLMALESGDLDMMKVLVRDHGADVNEEIEWNGRQSTPLIVSMSVSIER